MPSYLFVANRTLGGAPMLEAVRRRVGADAVFYLVVPAQPSRDEAGARLAEALVRFRAVGADFEGSVGDPHPVAAVHDALQGRHVDEIVICTLPAGISRLIQNDTPSKIARVFSIPVTHVIVPGDPADAGD